MVTILLCVVFGSLTFKGLTLVALMTWFSAHPFLFLIAIWELIHGFRLSMNFRY